MEEGGDSGNGGKASISIFELYTEAFVGYIYIKWYTYTHTSIYI